MEEYKIKFSICSIINNYEEYSEMKESFIRNGFSEDVCEYMIADNTIANNFDAYSAINRFLKKTNGEFIITKAK